MYLHVSSFYPKNYTKWSVELYSTHAPNRSSSSYCPVRLILPTIIQRCINRIRDKSWQSNNMLIYFVNLLAYRQQYTKYHNCIRYTMDMKLYTMKRKWWNCFIWHLVIASIVFVTYIPHNQDNAVCFVIGSRPITSLNRD